MPATIADSTNGDSVTLPSEVPKKAFHKFMGWCSTYTNTSSCSGTLYQPGASYNLSNGATTNLYAVWQQITDRSMQNVLEWGDTLSEGDEVVSYDTRDNRAYTVGKLKDGNVWMLDNLAFSDNTMTLDSSNTNIANGTTITINTMGTSGNHNAKSWSNSRVSAYIYDTYKDAISTNEMDVAGNWKIGTYYNYCAASAGTICSDSNDTPIKYDICPAGWRMATGDTGEYKVLNSKYSNYDAFRGALHAALSGYVYGGSTYERGGETYYWTSTYGRNGYAYLTTFKPTTWNNDTEEDRVFGAAVRCVAKEKTMQNIALWKNSLSEGENIQVKDERDNKVYWVGKQADGNVWMTQNLDFEITTEPLTSDTTDLTTYNAGGYTSSAGYTKDGNIIKWTPVATAITSGGTVPVSTATGTVSGLTGWTNNNYTPYSAEGGDVYVYTSNSDSDDTIYTSLADCIAASHTEAECKHYHRGNYYNWSAAVASNSTNVAELNTNYNTAANSICPAGWKLPIGAKANSFSQTNTEFAYLLKQSSIFTDYPSSLTGCTSYVTNGFNNIRSNPLFFVRSDYDYSGTYGRYWSSSVYSSTHAYNLYISSSSVCPAYRNGRDFGFSVRCVAR